MDYYETPQPSSKITSNVEVIVVSRFYHDGSKKEANKFFWFYDIQIGNLNNFAIQIIERHWRIFDASGFFFEVKGEGVVGKQPIMQAGEYFKYTSQVQLFTNSGLMYGEYSVINCDTQKPIVIQVPAFSLDSYRNMQSIN